MRNRLLLKLVRKSIQVLFKSAEEYFPCNNTDAILIFLNNDIESITPSFIIGIKKIT